LFLFCPLLFLLGYGLRPSICGKAMETVSKDSPCCDKKYNFGARIVNRDPGAKSDVLVEIFKYQSQNQADMISHRAFSAPASEGFRHMPAPADEFPLILAPASERFPLSQC